MAPTRHLESGFWCPHRIPLWKLCLLQKSVVSRFIPVWIYINDISPCLGFIIYSCILGFQILFCLVKSSLCISWPPWCSICLFILCLKVSSQLPDQITMLALHCVIVPNTKPSSSSFWLPQTMSPPHTLPKAGPAWWCDPWLIDLGRDLIHYGESLIRHIFKNCLFIHSMFIEYHPWCWALGVWRWMNPSIALMEFTVLCGMVTTCDFIWNF